MSNPSVTIPLEHPGGIVSAICAHGEFVFTGGDAGTIRVWKPAGGGTTFEGVAELAGHTGKILSLTVSTITPEGILVSTSVDGSARVWNMAAGGTLMQTLNDHAGQWVFDAKEMPMEGVGNTLNTCGLDNSVKVYKAGGAGWEALHSQPCQGKVTRLLSTTSPKGETILAAAQTNGEIVLFNGSAQFAIMGTLPGHPVVDDVVALEGVDGVLIVSGASDGILRVFQWA